MSDSPLSLAVQACETMMRKFDAPSLPPKGHFHYHQGVFLSGMLNTWRLTGDRRYFDYAKAWIDSVFDADGHMKDAIPGMLDDIQPGILLYPILDETGDEYYLSCLRSVRDSLRQTPRDADGGYWHKTTTPGQMWLDGLYMGGPFSMEYAARFGDEELKQTTLLQPKLMFEHTRDPKNGLLFHAWDGEKKEDWADPVTGCSPEHWGRAMGWVPVALLDEMDFLSGEEYDSLGALVKELLGALLPFQSEDGRWYQVVDKGDQKGNWLENSCSCLYTAALAKAVRTGLLSAKYAENARRGFAGVAASLGHDGDDLLIGNVCIGTGVGDYPFYCARPVSVNDLHGVGAFLLMCAEMERMERTGK